MSHKDDFIEILSNKAIELPIKIKTDDIISSLKIVYSQFNNYTRNTASKYTQLGITDLILNKIIKEEESIIRVISKYLDGYPADSYSTFRYCYKLIEEELNFFQVSNKQINQFDLRALFRMKYSESTRLHREDIFHVPLSQRKNVKSYRFSIPGLPAVYLGSSLYVCWEELNRPQLSNVYVSKYEFDKNKDFKLLNIAISPKLLESYIIEQSNEVVFDKFKKAFLNFITVWPLISSCHVIVQDQNLLFKPEYIVPQILTQYITKENEYDGLIYLSTKVNAYRINQNLCKNIVLPVKKQKIGYNFCSSLKEKLYLTEPVSIRLLETLFPLFGTLSTYRYNADFEIDEGISVQYEETEFGNIETKLAKKTMGKIVEKKI